MAFSRSDVVALAGGVLLAAIGVQGLLNALHDLHSVVTGQQRAMTTLQLAYSVVSPLPLLARWRRSPWTRPLLLLWGALLVAAVSLSPSAWGGASLRTDLITGVATTAIALLLGWLLLRGLPPRSRVPTA